jgi:O-antigen/teichoic acid export membrane protein
MTTESSSFRRNTAEVFATRIVGVALLVMTNVVITRSLSTHDRGVYALAYTLPILLQMFAGLGVSQANIYYVSRGARVRSVVLNSFLYSLAITAVLLLLGWAFHPFLLRTLLKGMTTTYLFLLLAVMPFSFMDVNFTGVIQGLQKFRLFNTRRLVVAGIMFTSACVTQLVFHLKLAGAIGSWVLTIVVTGLLFLVIVVREDGFSPHVDWALARKMVTYGGKAYVASLAGYLSYRVDVFLMALLRGPRQVAYYAVAVSLVEMIWYIPDSVGVVLFPRLSAAESDRERHQFTARVCRITVFVTVISAALIALLSRFLIVLLFHHRYLPSVVPLLLLLPGAVSIAVYKILWRNFSGRNRQQITVIAATIAVALNVGLNFGLIPRYGPSGASISSTVSYTVGTVILLLAFRRESGISVRKTLVVRGADLQREYSRIRRRLARDPRPDGGSL